MNKRFFNIVLVEPEIPNNTGNIGRTCVGTNSRLHLVGKLGFEISDKQLRRAGLDYWKDVDWVHHPTWDSWREQISDPSRVFYFSTKATKLYSDAEFRMGDWFVFGKETKGLDESIVRENDAQALMIPQFGPIRSLNVANAAAIVVYEAIRQLRPSPVKL
ncbi:MAG: tRNA (cytidine(34)-2'-O)-methyltransferase [Bdellovibrionia bacterium]